MKTLIALLLTATVGLIAAADAPTFVTNGFQSVSISYTNMGSLEATNSNRLPPLFMQYHPYLSNGVSSVIVEGLRLVKEPSNGFAQLLTESSRTNIVNDLIETGEFCRVRGHAWGGHLHVTLEYVTDKIGCRECKVCGQHQTQYASEWK